MRLLRRKTHGWERVLRKIKVLHNVMIHYYKINHDEQMLNPIGFWSWGLAKGVIRIGTMSDVYHIY